MRNTTNMKKNTDNGLMNGNTFKVCYDVNNSPHDGWEASLELAYNKASHMNAQYWQPLDWNQLSSTHHNVGCDNGGRRLSTVAYSAIYGAAIHVGRGV